MNSYTISPSKKTLFRIIAIVTLLLNSSSIAYGQYTLNIPKDSTIQAAPLNVTIEDMASSRLKKSKMILENNKTVQSQNNAFALINIEIQKANAALQRGFDYKGFTKEINLLIEWKDFAVDGITINKNKTQTIRDLTTTTLLLNELQSRTANQINKIKNNNEALSSIQKRLDSLATNQALYLLPNDSIAKNNYFQRLTLLTQDIDETNNKLKNAIDSIQTLEIKGEIFKNNLNADIVKVQILRKIESDSLFSRKTSFLNTADITERSFLKELKHSYKKEYFVLLFFGVNNSSVIKLFLLAS